MSVESSYRSRDDLMADPAATPLDTDKQLILTEQALRLANSIILRTKEYFDGQSNSDQAGKRP